MKRVVVAVGGALLLTGCGGGPAVGQAGGVPRPVVAGPVLPTARIATALRARLGQARAQTVWALAAVVGPSVHEARQSEAPPVAHPSMTPATAPASPSAVPAPAVIAVRTMADPILDQQSNEPPTDVAGFAVTWNLPALTVTIGPGAVDGQMVFTGATLTLPSTIPAANATPPGWPEIDVCGASTSTSYSAAIYSTDNPPPTQTPAGYATDTCVPVAFVGEDVTDGMTGQQWQESTPTWFTYVYAPLSALPTPTTAAPSSTASTSG